MANVSHATLTGSDLHEPKGVAAASAGQVYVADGAGSGSWSSPSVPGVWALISTQTASGSSALNFTGFNSSLYRDYRLVLDNLLPTTNGDTLWLRTSTNGGSGYDSGASDYVYAFSGYTQGGSGVQQGSTGIAQILLSRTNSNAANFGISGEVTIYNPSAAAYCRMIYQTFGFTGSGTGTTILQGGAMRATASDVDAVRILFSTGTIASGAVRFYGLKL